MKVHRRFVHTSFVDFFVHVTDRLTQSLFELENLLRSFIDTQAVMRLHSEVLEEITQEIAKGDQVVSIFYCLLQSTALFPG
jgi:hypothetical protein